MLDQIHKPLIKLTDRAERIEPEIIAKSFVDAKPLFDILSTENNQILYGRRGTGKTHILIFLSKHVQENGEPAIYIDLRELGSNNSLYADKARPLPERATRLVQDVLSALHDELLKLAINHIDLIENPNQVTNALDSLADECSRTKVQGETVITESHGTETASSIRGGANAEIGTRSKIDASFGAAKEEKSSDSAGASTTGVAVSHIVFGSLQDAVRKVLGVLGVKRLWLLLDEWSVIPVELQPYMADILRRCFFPISNVSIKFAAIEHRSNFKIPLNSGQYIGLEVGADASADVNLDDFMVFDNDGDKSKDFFARLIFNHLLAAEPNISTTYSSPSALIAALFNQSPTFEEFVRATEGVPRDALHLLGIAVAKNFGHAITMPVVRTSASTWYVRDKTAAATENSHLNDFLQRIIAEVIGHRRARAFLVRADARNQLIDELFDLRLLHILKRNISSHDSAGIRYHAFKLDYGCYVNLITTSQATKGLLNTDDDQYLDVPPDDWRSIRRAILDPKEFTSGGANG